MAEEKGDKEEKKGGGKKMIIIILAVVLLLGGAVGGTLFFTGALSGDKEGAEHSEEGDGHDAKGADAPPLPALYHEIDPAFVVNFEGKSKAKFLQLTVSLMTRDALALAAIEAHMPLIRNNLVMLFSSQTYDGLSTREGKEKLREESLAEVNRVMEQETGHASIESIFFTSIVMQ